MSCECAQFVDHDYCARRGSQVTTSAITDDTASLLHPAAAVSPDEGVMPIYRALRADILDGRLEQGAVINQVHLARQLGVSRTPLREALRMLQADGLVDAERQRRMHVTTVHPHQVDTLYAERILLECMALAITIPRLGAAEMVQVPRLVHEINARGGKCSTEEQVAEREELHKTFHGLITSLVSPSFHKRIAECTDFSDRYRRIYLRDPVASSQAKTDHVAIATAAAARDIPAAVEALTRHYSRTAYAVTGLLDPDYEPVAVKLAISMVRKGLL